MKWYAKGSVVVWWAANLGYKSLWKSVKLFKKILVSKAFVSEGISQINLCGVYRIRSL